MVWSYAIHDTQSGDFLSLVQPSEGRWGRGSVQERQHVFPLRDDGFSRSQRQDLFQTDDRTLVQRFNGVPVYAGLITEPDYDKDAELLTVPHIDLRYIASWRHLFGAGWYDPAGEVVCTSLSRRGLARRFLYLGFVYPFSSAWPLPVNLPAEETGSISRTFYHYDGQTIEELLSDLQAEPNGPDVDLQPVYNGGRLEWDARIGSPYLTGPAFEVRLDGDLPATGVGTRHRGQRKTTGVFSFGRGTEQDMRIGWAAVPESAGISKDVIIAHKDVDDLARLTSLAQGELDAVKQPPVQWRMRVRASQVDFATLRIGSKITTHSTDDPWINDGPKAHRVIGFDGDLTDTITLTLEAE